MMTELEFEALASEGYNRIALVSECMSDLETPLSVYLKLAARDENTFLLESAEGGKSFSRKCFRRSFRFRKQRRGVENICRHRRKNAGNHSEIRSHHSGGRRV